MDVNPEKRCWTNATEIEIYKAANQVCHNRGGVAWSLNLSQDKIQLLMRAAANGNDPMRPLTKELNRQFHKHLGSVPPYAIAFEFNDRERLHGHAAGILRWNAAEELNRFGAATAAAGGKIRGTAGRG